jgi:hypothetical protein
MRNRQEGLSEEVEEIVHVENEQRLETTKAHAA